MELSKRLQAVADMVTVGNTAADIGCDHGYASIYLILNQICPKVIAMDVNTGPLEKAKEHIRRYGLEAYIETRLSDGTENMPENLVDTLICAGMGGKLTVKILAEGSPKIKSLKELILQPQSEIHLVRRYVREHGFVVTRENMIHEEGKYYQVMKAERDSLGLVQKNSDQAELELFDDYGECLLRAKNPVLEEFLIQKKVSLQSLLQKFMEEEHKTEKLLARISEMEGKIKRCEDALLFYRKLR